jgi:GNAT superfamily N-acetyltransferase
MPTPTVRFATAADVSTILRFIKGLAAFEHEPDAVNATESDLLRDGFGPAPKFEVLIAEVETEPVGFALFFFTYSTWEGRPGLHLEDIFVVEHLRGQGVGMALMVRLAAIAVERDYGRLELSVLHWNPARQFYHALGMQHMEEWLPYRISGEALKALASRTTMSRVRSPLSRLREG